MDYASSGAVAIIGRVIISLAGLLLGGLVVFWGTQLYREGVRARTANVEVAWKDARFVLVGGAPGAFLSLSGLLVAITALLTSPTFVGDGSRVEISVQRTEQSRTELRGLASETILQSGETARATVIAYAAARSDFRVASLTDSAVAAMEARAADLERRVAKLDSLLDATDRAGAQHFALLEARARQSQTPELRRQSLSEIRAREAAFGQQIHAAREALAGLRAAVRRYDDITAQVQIRSGLTGVGVRPVELDRMIDAANARNGEMQTALRNGLANV